MFTFMFVKNVYKTDKLLGVIYVAKQKQKQNSLYPRKFKENFIIIHEFFYLLSARL